MKSKSSKHKKVSSAALPVGPVEVTTAEAAAPTATAPPPAAPPPEMAAKEAGGTCGQELPISATLVQPTELELALEQHQAQLEAIPHEGMAALNVDPFATASVVRALEVRWTPYRTRMAALMAKEDWIENLVGLARATMQAWTNERAAYSSSPKVYESLKRGTLLRDNLVVEAGILVRRGLMDPAALEKVERGSGYRNVACGLSVVSQVLKERWPVFRGKTAITEQDLEVAQQLGDSLLPEAALRDDISPEVLKARKLTAQAFTAMLRAYEEVQRAFEFLEPEAIDYLAPSLYTKVRKVALRGGVSAEPAEGAAPNPVAQGGAPSPAGGPEAPNATVDTTPIGPGGLVLPSPFR